MWIELDETNFYWPFLWTIFLWKQILYFQLEKNRNNLSNVNYLEEIKLIKSSERQYIYLVLGNIELGDLEDQVLKALAKSGVDIKQLYIKSFATEISVEMI